MNRYINNSFEDSSEILIQITEAEEGVAIFD